MNIRHVVSVFVLATISSLSCASVTYQFQANTLPSQTSAVTGYIVLTDAAAASGTVDYSYKKQCGVGKYCASDPSSPILAFYFDVAGPLGKVRAMNFDIVNGLGFFQEYDFYASFGISGGALIGTMIHAQNIESAVTFTGTSFQYAADDGSCFRFACNGVGSFELLEAAAVPEPGSLPMIGLGVIAAAGAIRLRRRG